MESENILKVAVVSDLHFNKNNNPRENPSVSFLTFDDSGNLNEELWQELLKRIEKESLGADLLICPGDITTYGDMAGLSMAWGKLNELGEKLCCDVIAVATGNHDVQSRPQAKSDNMIRSLNKPSDLIEGLKQLNPIYPLVVRHEDSPKEAHCRRVEYFGSDYLIYDDHPKFRIVILNSCARHTHDPNDHDRGYVADSALEWLEEQLKERAEILDSKPSILLCHHHPIQHDCENLGSYDFLLNGGKLIKMLSNYGEWVVVHGHKHHASLSYGGGGSKQIPVFAAGTLAAHKETLGKGFNNQFYIMDIQMDDLFDGLKGQIKAWSWAGNRWMKSKSKDDGIFEGVGFGLTKNISKLALEIEVHVPSVTAIKWNDVVKKIPDLRFMVPDDFLKLENQLSKINIDVHYNADNELEGLSRAGETHE
jgi:3',5'-cyclic AMP phosphodiesterase CpdA